MIQFKILLLKILYRSKANLIAHFKLHQNRPYKVFHFSEVGSVHRGRPLQGRTAKSGQSEEIRNSAYPIPTVVPTGVINETQCEMGLTRVLVTFS